MTFNDSLIKNIKEFGFSIIQIHESDYLPSFAYTIGLWENYNHPEIIGFGLRIETLHEIINDIAVLIKKGDIIKLNQNYSELFESGRAEFIEVDNRNIIDYFGTAINHYDHENFKAIQLVWPDRNNKFPWEKDFEEVFLYKQPLLDRNANFKYRENPNLATFTTRQWLEEEKPILKVVHELDGDWQFLTGDQFPEDGRIVAIDQLIKKDLTLNEVFNLEYGESAEREYIGGEWTRTENEEEDDDE
jgi:Domain of unknown function (DUF4262)